MAQVAIDNTGYLFLVVDDDPDDIFLMKRALGRVNESMTQQAELATASNGAEALELLRKQATIGTLPDLVLLDLNMPVMNGFEFLKHCRADERLRNLEVVVVTTATDDTTHEAALALGANAVYAKPTSREAMSRLVSDVVQNWFLD